MGWVGLIKNMSNEWGINIQDLLSGNYIKVKQILKEKPKDYFLTKALLEAKEKKNLWIVFDTTSL